MDTISVWDAIRPFIPLLIPVIVLELALFIAALVDLIKRPKTTGPKWMWVLLLFIQFIGPIVYFIVGRKED